MSETVEVGLTKSQGFEKDVSLDLEFLKLLNIAIQKSDEETITMTASTKEDFEYKCPYGYRCDYRLKQHIVHYEWCWIDHYHGKTTCDCTGTHTFIDSRFEEPCPYHGLPLSPQDECPRQDALQQEDRRLASKPRSCDANSFNDNFLGFPAGKGEVLSVQQIIEAHLVYEKRCPDPLGGDGCPTHKEFHFDSRTTETEKISIGIEVGKSIGKMASSVSEFAEKDFFWEDTIVIDQMCPPQRICTAMAAILQVAVNWCRYGSDGSVVCDCFDTVTYTNYHSVSYYCTDFEGKPCKGTKESYWADEPQFLA